MNGKKRFGRVAILLALLFVFVGLIAPRTLAQEVQNHEMTLSMAIGERSGVFTGVLQDGLPMGIGTFEFHCPRGILWRYEGAFDAGDFHGDGDVVSEYGDRHVGTFYRSRLHGEGRIYNTGNLTHRGVFVQGELWDGTIYMPFFGVLAVVEGRSNGLIAVFAGLIFVFLAALGSVIFFIRRAIRITRQAGKKIGTAMNCKKCGTLNAAGRERCSSCQRAFF